MDRETAKEYLKNREPDFLQPARRKAHGHTSYICPNPDCESGSHSKGTGIALVPNTEGGRRYHCFRCGLTEDIIGLWKIHTGITDNREAFEGLYDYYSLQVDDRPTVQGNYRERNTSKAEMNDKKDVQANYVSYYRECQKRITETDYPQKRGLSPEIVTEYMLGYDAHFSNKGTGGREWKALIIPTGESSYVARNTDPQADKDNRYRKTGATQLFNAKKALRQDVNPVFIVEGELDALSIIEVGGQAIGLGSASNYTKFLELLKKKKPEMPLILALDDDPAGTKATKELARKLEKLGVTYTIADLYGDQKDANSLLLKDRKALQERVRKAVKEAQNLTQREKEPETQKEEYSKRNCVASHLQEFINSVHESVNTPCISTGFQKLDTVLEGGLYEGLYIVGAISSLGKTTLITQIADQIAAAGQDVLIFSLEMARSEIMAKSISRLTILDVLQNNGDTRDAKTTRGITTGSRYASYSVAELDLINRAIAAYAGYAGHLYIVEGVGSIGVDQVREVVKQHAAFTGSIPVVMIDYLQILAPYSERASDKQNTDKAVMELKRISRDYKTPVIAISSFNRASYKEAVTMEAFKESGAIEYSSDVLIGLQMKGAGKKDFDADAAKTKNPREVELVLLKNRNGATGKTVEYEYYPLFNYFKEV